jgi:hypothetical protein
MPGPDVILISSMKQNIKTQIAYEMKNNRMKGLITIFTAFRYIICFSLAFEFCFLKPCSINIAVFATRVTISKYKN